MRIALVCIIIVAGVCWTLEGYRDWPVPVGTIGTTVLYLGLIVLGAIKWKRHQPTLTTEEFEAGYIDRKVAQHHDGNVVG